jgi:acyl-CoA thioesterase FadM
VIVYVDPENFRPVPVPDFVKERLSGNLEDVG